MKKVVGWLTNKKLKTFNIPAASPFSWLLEPIMYRSPEVGKMNWENEVQKVKHDSIQLFYDDKAKSKQSVLILVSSQTNIKLAKLVLGLRAQGFKSWILESKYGTQKEFEAATKFIKDTSILIACGTWYNRIQGLEKPAAVLVVDPKIQLDKLNHLIQKENELELEIIKRSQEFNISSTKNRGLVEPLQELRPHKNHFLFFLNSRDLHGYNFSSPGVVVHSGIVGSEPLGCKEQLIPKILKSLLEINKPK
jgi:hypothetical protein